ncbi:hypothetical protein B0H19DRAFT_1230470 [Mycena capillaripes]|nr:hypothetical protein B0H19DRAFT_1230470 [Mycena capillaripes]
MDWIGLKDLQLSTVHKNRILQYYDFTRREVQCYISSAKQLIPLIFSGRYDHVRLTSDVTSNINFAVSKWIWSATATANTFVGLRKSFTPPEGKALIATEIIFTVFTSLTFYENGVEIGTGNGLPDYRPLFARRFCVDLLPSFTVFAFNTSTSGSGADEGIAIRLTYSDGTKDTLVTDSFWRAKEWDPARIRAAIVGRHHLPVARRHTDNAHTPYVNGVSIGSVTNFKIAQHYTVNFASAPSEVVLAVLTKNNTASAAGLLVAMELNMVPARRTNCTAGAFVMSDVGWNSTKDSIPAGFEQPRFDDSTWPAVVVEADYTAAAWGTLTIAASSPSVMI